MYVELLAKWREAILNQEIEAFFTKAEENSTEMRTTYQTLGNIERFSEWLEKKARDEINGHTRGQMYSLNVGGFDE